MAAGVKDIVIEQGATYRLSLTWRQPPVDPDTVGEPYDLTDVSSRMQIRNREVDKGGDVLLELTSEAGEGITIDTEGRIYVVITDEQTRTLVVKKGVYDLYVTFPGGDTRRVLRGKVAVSFTVTDPTEAPVG